MLLFTDLSPSDVSVFTDSLSETKGWGDGGGGWGGRGGGRICI